MCGIAVVLGPAAASPAAAAPPRCQFCATDGPPTPTPTLAEIAVGLRRRGPDCQRVHSVFGFGSRELTLAGAVLHMRGATVTPQPVIGPDGSALLFNGEIFGGGVAVARGGSDTVALASALATAADIPSLLSSLRGPWALVYYHAPSRTLWYGRDAVGRRSLLHHAPCCHDPRFLLASVAPPLPHPPAGDAPPQAYWAELHPGIYSLGSGGSDGPVRHDWTDALLRTIAAAARPPAGEDNEHNEQHNEHVTAEDDPARWPPARAAAAAAARSALAAAVARHVADLAHVTDDVMTDDVMTDDVARLGVLFSGGLDSSLLARLADLALCAAGDAASPIALVTVCFDGGGSPDRRSAIAGAEALRGLAPNRPWQLVTVDARRPSADCDTTASIQWDSSQWLMGVLHPAGSHMDAAIGAAVRAACRGNILTGTTGNILTGTTAGNLPAGNIPRALLHGAGADELCGGYSRHRTAFRHGGHAALAESLAEDVRRLWLRTLGRDDRASADTGRELRQPFLDEEFMGYVLSLPLADVVDLRSPPGVGDKRLLRDVGVLLGLGPSGVAGLPKRAIQFGTRVAKQANVAVFGSNRRANRLHAGSRAVGLGGGD